MDSPKKPCGGVDSTESSFVDAVQSAISRLIEKLPEDTRKRVCYNPDDFRNRFQALLEGDTFDATPALLEAVGNLRRAGNPEQITTHADSVVKAMMGYDEAIPILNALDNAAQREAEDLHWFG